jgi:dynactin complex subunit|uniref:Uncharacterized protein n=1 Tax=Desulfobacca acetoxidans TaxID=60893 RepID=A0A7C5ALK9_9BACT
MVNQLQDNDAQLQLQRARELLAQGQHQQALILALDALQSVLDNLRSALANLHRNLAQIQKEGSRAEPNKEELDKLLKLHRELKVRLYH